jgi:sterol desaturase/sphingolipid hydroxylase (fatty acid hydroxylase superfamily)
MDPTARIILIVVLIVLLLAALPVWPYAAGWGPWPASGAGFLLVILLVLILLRIL